MAESYENCKNCGAKYKLTEIKLIQRDMDSIKCEKCGHELISWNGAVAYTAELIN